MTIGERIATLRKERNLSQYALAKSASIAYSTLHMIESGKRSGTGLTIATALRIARALEVTLDILVTGTDDEVGRESEPAAVELVGA